MFNLLNASNRGKIFSPKIIIILADIFSNSEQTSSSQPFKPEALLCCWYLDWRRAPGDPGRAAWWCGRWARPVRCPGRWLTAAAWSASSPSSHPAPGLCSPPRSGEDGPLEERRKPKRRVDGIKEDTKEKKKTFRALWAQICQDSCYNQSKRR